MNKILKTSIATIAILGSNALVLEAYAGSKEKCYGVVKAAQNDCATKTSSCAGSSKTDGQKDAFIALPNGLCDKLVGGSVGKPADSGSSSDAY
ncbi:Putative signal peptide protein [uncultured Candidatus Thioglobus sp.]|nr:Putative signal peptide protein [uncultured Candidatus Thioglobus sp.]